MSLNSILSSPTQRRRLLVLWVAVLVIGTWVAVEIEPFTKNSIGWNVTYGMVSSIVASGIFALVTALFGYFFLLDPKELTKATVLLPQDVGSALESIANEARNYCISVRTGRHFRAEILPILVREAPKRRQPIKVEVVLLDFRDEVLCDKYAKYRKASASDRDSWSTEYVQKEVLATILKIIEASRANLNWVTVDLYLSKRLSMFRIEGSSEQMLVTREGPKDMGARYRKDHRDFPAYVNEFAWIRDEAFRVQPLADGGLPATLTDMFVGDVLVGRLEAEAKKAASLGSPYGR